MYISDRFFVFVRRKMKPDFRDVRHNKIDEVNDSIQCFKPGIKMSFEFIFLIYFV